MLGREHCEKLKQYLQFLGQFGDDGVLTGHIKVAPLLIVACPPVDRVGLIEWRYCPAQQINRSYVGSHGLLQDFCDKTHGKKQTDQTPSFALVNLLSNMQGPVGSSHRPKLCRKTLQTH